MSRFFRPSFLPLYLLPFDLFAVCFSIIYIWTLSIHCSFETENKIFAQEAGKIAGKDVAHEGTSGVGWYQYIGDDGKVYRVDYEAGAQGFVPKVCIYLLCFC